MHDEVADDSDDDDDGVGDTVGASESASTAAADRCVTAVRTASLARPEPATLSWGTCSSARKSGRTMRTDRTGCPCASTVQWRPRSRVRGQTRTPQMSRAKVVFFF